ncbi:MAG TPA: ABC transporter permease [Steroidobacteraceae bacterium]|nr:ABC transporter permease [Steroidobacteraceae bacterium]
MQFFKQLMALVRLNLSGITQRLGPVLTVVIGVTCAVGTLVSLLAMGSGAQRQAMANVRPDRVVITGVGAQRDMPLDAAVTIRNLPGIRKGVDGESIVTLESTVQLESRRRVTGTRINFPLVGVSSTVEQLLPELRLTDGRMFQRGLYEFIVSNPCVRQFTGFEIGARRPIRGNDWTIVGHFDIGAAQQCVAYTDVDTLNSAIGRTSYDRATLMLSSPSDFEALRAAALADPTLHVEVMHEREAVELWFKQLNALLNFVSYFVGSIMAIGATLGAVNSLYAMVDSRRRELATLKAIGFRPGAIVVSILCESVVLAIPGALLGCALGWALFNGLSASPFGFSFQLAVTPNLAIIGVVWALVMGVIGGLLPALRAARVPVTEALRAT